LSTLGAESQLANRVAKQAIKKIFFIVVWFLIKLIITPRRDDGSWLLRHIQKPCKTILLVLWFLFKSRARKINFQQLKQQKINNIPLANIASGKEYLYQQYQQ
jgi:hypothetical protein